MIEYKLCYKRGEDKYNNVGYKRGEAGLWK